MTAWMENDSCSIERSSEKLLIVGVKLVLTSYDSLLKVLEGFLSSNLFLKFFSILKEGINYMTYKCLCKM